MAGQESLIKSGVDYIIELLEKKKKLTVPQVAKELGVSINLIDEWSNYLEKEGIIYISEEKNNKFLCINKEWALKRKFII